MRLLPSSRVLPGYRVLDLGKITGMPNREPNVAERIVELFRVRILTTAELLGSGLSSHGITAAVRAGSLMRLRRGIYVAERVPAEISDAVAFGGRVTCVTLLWLIGIFVLDRPGLHVHAAPDLSRSRRRRPRHAVVHWGICAYDGLRHAVSIEDAVRQAMRCQSPRAALATLDSVLHHRVLTLQQVTEIVHALPRRFHTLLALIDASAESGSETLMRLILRTLGVTYRTQVEIPGVGRVDFVVDGWLIIECDSRRFHEGWDHQVEDRRRDIAAATLGYVTIRPLAADIFDRPGTVAEAVRAVMVAFGPAGSIRQHPQLRRSGLNQPETPRQSQ